MSENGATNGDGATEQPDGWTSLRPDPGNLARSEAVKVRKATLGLKAAVDTVQRNPDALWVDSAQGLRAVDRSDPEKAHAAIERARQAFIKKHANGMTSNGASSNGNGASSNGS